MREGKQFMYKKTLITRMDTVVEHFLDVSGGQLLSTFNLCHFRDCHWTEFVLDITFWRNRRLYPFDNKGRTVSLFFRNFICIVLLLWIS